MIGFWAGMAIHYLEVLKKYAEMKLHISAPALYIASETWLLVCCVMLTILALIPILRK